MRQSIKLQIAQIIMSCFYRQILNNIEVQHPSPAMFAKQCRAIMTKFFFLRQNKKIMYNEAMKKLSESNHMKIPWKNYAQNDADVLISQASLVAKAAMIGRLGLELLSCGTGAWRVRSSLNRISKSLGVVCSFDIGLMTISFNCFDGTKNISQSLSLSNTGVNTYKLYALEKFVKKFAKERSNMTCAEFHKKLDEFGKITTQYSIPILGLASAVACCGFTFLLGGGLWEMLLAFIGAGIGNMIRNILIRRKYTLFMNVAISVSAACFSYAVLFRILHILFNIGDVHQSGYICAILFIIPGFPFITSGIDLAKLDLRSGIERLTYAVIIILVATLSAWVMALILNLKPIDFELIEIKLWQKIIFRLIASFFGVFGFSIMFNSPLKLAATASCIGSLANTLRLELVDLCNFPPALAAFCGAFTAGLLASLLKRKIGYPRISITVPSIVIMVPGLYFYKGIYNLGIMSLSESASWLSAAILIAFSLPLGLVSARILTDRSFRHAS